MFANLNLKKVIDKKQFEILIKNTLAEIEMGSPAVVDLILGTAAQESKFGTYIRQLGDGPALGVFQMEANTFIDIVQNYLFYRKDLTERIKQVCNVSVLTPSLLVFNLKIAVIFARIQYLRVSEKLPEDLEGMAKYWKDHYNTKNGKGTEAEFIANYKKYVQ